MDKIRKNEEEDSVSSDDEDWIRDSLHYGKRMPRKSTAGNPDSYFQFFKDILCQTMIDKNNRILKMNNFPISVETGTKLSKVHYIFQMLGVNVVYVRNFEGMLVGEITKEKFLNLRYSMPSSNRMNKL